MPNLKKIFLFVMIGALSLSALIGIIILLIGKGGITQTKIIVTTLSLGFYCLLGLACAALYEKNKNLLSLIGCVVAIIGFIYSVNYIWEIISWSYDSWFWKINLKILFTSIILTLAFAHYCLIRFIENKKNIVRIAVNSTLICTGIFVIMFNVAMWFEISDDLFIRLIGVSAICAALGTICSPILNKIYKNEVTDGADSTE